MTTLASAREQYREQQRITELGGLQALRASRSGPRSFARTVRTYQLRAVELAIASAPLILQEQGLPTAAAVTVVPAALLTEPVGLSDLVQQADSQARVTLLARSFITNASRTATLVDTAPRRAATGYVRHLQPPSCGRCAVLVGRVYRYSTGFRRHPRCDCLMTPTSQALGPEIITDPTVLFERGQISGLSEADTEALSAGADLGQVVNIRRRAAGLTVQGSVLTRAGRLTPEGIYRQASGAEAVSLLRANGYIL